MKHKQAVSALSAVALGLVTTSVLTGATHPPPAASPGGDVQLAISKIYWEYNASANDLGVHVFLDGEDWKRLEIESPEEQVIFNVRGSGPYAELGMTELFFEGAEPSLGDVRLAELLDMFPQGEYEFSGRTVDGEEIEGIGRLSHAIPAGPNVFAEVGSNNFLRINWSLVTSPPAGFPNLPVDVVAYQVIVGSFQVTVPAPATRVTVSREFVASLAPGVHPYEVLAIEASGNQTLTEGTFVK